MEISVFFSLCTDNISLAGYIITLYYLFTLNSLQMTPEASLLHTLLSSDTSD